MAYKDKEEFFDGLWDHLFDDGEPDDEDQKWFDEKVIPFFDKLIGEGAPTGGDNDNSGNSGGTGRRKRPASTSGVSGPRRKRRTAASGSGNYGANLFFGGN